MDENNADINMETNKNLSARRIVKGITIIVLAFSLGYVHYRYVSHLFENNTHFSYLSELEREMSLRTEMGFYYSYYKTMVEEQPFISGISKLMYDRIVEYPKDVNAFNRFNIHPEVMVAAIYRYFEPYINNTEHRQCHMIDRGPDLAPVESCVGLGQPIFLYLEAIWWLAGLTVTALFLHATALSESILGGLLAVAQYFANHAECTRVQWCPNERENFAVPLLLLQTWLVSMQLRDNTRKTAFQLQISIFVLNCLCLLFWQFSQFIFLTQTVIFFVMEQLKIIDIKTLCIFLHSHFCGLHMAVLLLQGNDMLKSSLYASFFLIVSTYCLFFSTFRVKVQNRVDLFFEIWLVILRILIVVLTSIYLKKLISSFLELEEDSHIWDILMAKFTNFKSFHTLIYTCSEVFDFLPLSSVRKLFKSFLIPFVTLGVFNVCTTWVNLASFACVKEIQDIACVPESDGNTSDESDSGIENSDTKRRGNKNGVNLDSIDKKLKAKIEMNDLFLMYLKNLKVDPAIFYNVSQLVVFAIMAALIMRLKLLFVTQLCVVSSLFMNSGFYKLSHKYVKYLPIFWAICMTPMAHDMFNNITQELSHIGEFSDIAQEQLMEWIRTETPTGAAFAGSMPLLASIMLITRRPIVAHPHYEHKEARDRVYAVYKMYGKFSPQELYQELNKLQASYLVVENTYCYGKSSNGCAFQDIWDVEAPWYSNRLPTCRILLNESVEHFYPVFRNQQYAVFKIHDYSVRYMPRSFDT